VSRAPLRPEAGVGGELSRFPPPQAGAGAHVEVQARAARQQGRELAQLPGCRWRSQRHGAWVDPFSVIALRPALPPAANGCGPRPARATPLLLWGLAYSAAAGSGAREAQHQPVARPSRKLRRRVARPATALQPTTAAALSELALQRSRLAMSLRRRSAGRRRLRRHGPRSGRAVARAAASTGLSPREGHSRASRSAVHAPPRPDPAAISTSPLSISAAIVLKPPLLTTSRPSPGHQLHQVGAAHRLITTRSDGPGEVSNQQGHRAAGCCSSGLFIKLAADAVAVPSKTMPLPAPAAVEARTLRSARRIGG